MQAFNQRNMKFFQIVISNVATDIVLTMFIECFMYLDNLLVPTAWILLQWIGGCRDFSFILFCYNLQSRGIGTEESQGFGFGTGNEKD